MNNKLRLYPNLSVDGIKDKIIVYGEKSQIGDVVLLQLYSKMQTKNAEPIAAETLIGALKDKIDDIKWSLILVDKKSINSTIQWLNKKPPLVIGISIPQGTLPIAQKIIKSIYKKPSFKNTQIVFGHAIPTFLNKFFDKNYPKCEVISGWGENDFVNIVFKKLNKSKNTVDENNFPIPIRVGKKGEYFRRIEASRGCGYGSCSFCARTSNGPNYTENTIDNLQTQLEQLKKIGDKYFGFSDEDFMGDPKKINEFIKIIKPYHLFFSAALRVETIIPNDSKLKAKRICDIKKLVDSGLKLAFIGVESLVETQQRRYNKHIIGGVNSCIQATSVLLKFGCDVNIGMIIFDPESTIAELKETTNILLKNELYKYIGHPFNSLFLREGSILAKKYNLSKKYLNLNTLEYKWNFSNQEVCIIYKKCIKWWRPLEKKIILVRNLLRETPGENNKKIKEKYHDILKQTVIVLKKATNNENNFKSETQKIIDNLQYISTKISK